ncbi:MAG: hypothetical protein K2H65_02645 [Bacteroidales bacterium]|nr:hypothetical protein [Bacteroidales bacterium]
MVQDDGTCLAAGIRKSKRAGIPITSRWLRDSIDKLCRYYGLTLMCSLVDLAQNSTARHRWPYGGLD